MRRILPTFVGILFIPAPFSTIHSFPHTVLSPLRPPSSLFAHHDSHRRDFLSHISAALMITSSSSPSSASDTAINDPTRIELTVDTEYLVRVLNFFDGDMRKVLGAIVRSPFTKVEIDPPKKGFSGAGYGTLSPRDAILRALYSYENPDDYQSQASWLKVDSPNAWMDLLTRKRYEIEIPYVDAAGGEKKGLVRKVVIKPATTIRLSNVEAVAALAGIAYPVAYGWYNYESWREDQEKLAKKQALAAKQKQKTSKGTVVQKAEDKRVPEARVTGPVQKGQEANKQLSSKKSVDSKLQTPKSLEDETMVPNAMTDALNAFFGNTPSSIDETSISELPMQAVSRDHEPLGIQPDAAPFVDSSYSEVLPQLTNLEVSAQPQQPSWEPELSAYPTQSLIPEAETMIVIPPTSDTTPARTVTVNVATRVTKSKSGGMSAYEAQMASLTNAASLPMQDQSLTSSLVESPPSQGNSLRSLVSKGKKSGGMAEYEAQMRAMMAKKQ